MEENNFFKFLIFALVIGWSIVAKIIETAKKNQRKLERRREQDTSTRSEEPRAGQGGGKSLAEWIEEVKRNAEAESPAPPPSVEQPKRREPVFEREEEILEVEPAPRPRPQPEPVPSQEETRREKRRRREQEAAEEPYTPRARRIEEDGSEYHEEGETDHRHGRGSTLTSRIAPRYEGEHAEQLVEREGSARRAKRAKRARRGKNADGELAARTSLGMLDISGDGLRKAFILKELLSPPMALRDPGQERT